MDTAVQAAGRLIFNRVRRGLFGAIFVSFLYLVISLFLVDRESWHKKVLSIFPALETTGVFSHDKERDYSAFMREIENKKIFAPLYVEKKEAKAEVDRDKLNKIIENFRMVGILPKDPRRVIIEDQRLGKTFYLKEGESFLDNITVKKIEKGSVILNYYGEEFELYL
ncbi:MAG: hypothetical protein ABH858_06445 [Candidatus Omnitrophota bacterium]